MPPFFSYSYFAAYCAALTFGKRWARMRTNFIRHGGQCHASTSQWWCCCHARCIRKVSMHGCWHDVSGFSSSRRQPRCVTSGSSLATHVTSGCASRWSGAFRWLRYLYCHVSHCQVAMCCCRIRRLSSMSWVYWGRCSPPMGYTS